MVDSGSMVRHGAMGPSWDPGSDTGLLRLVQHMPRSSGSLPFSYRRTGTALAIVDACQIVVLSCVTNGGYHLLTGDGLGDMALAASMGACCALFYVLSIHAQRRYAPSEILSGRSQVVSSLATWCAAFGCLIALAFFSHLSVTLSRFATLLFFASGAVAVPLTRVAARRLMTKLIAENRLAGRRRVLLVGDAETRGITSIRAGLQRHGYNVLGEAALPALTPEGRSLEASVLGRIKVFVREHRIDEIFLALDPSHQDRVAETMRHFSVFPLPVRLICGPALNALLSRPITDLGPDMAIELQRGPLTFAQQATKRAFDLVLASLGLVALAPFLALVAVLIRLESPGPALFRQRRAGFNGITFKIFKFRSMTVMDDGAVVRQAKRNDDRVTRIGRFLRRSSIDELPQLLNVLKGEMSLVGPRPHALSHDNEYDKAIASYAFRHHMKPGITGWAQVNGCRGETSTLSMMEQRIDYDLWYIKHWSLTLDLISLWRTVAQMVRPGDVY